MITIVIFAIEVIAAVGILLWMRRARRISKNLQNNSDELERRAKILNEREEKYQVLLKQANERIDEVGCFLGGTVTDVSASYVVSENDRKNFSTPAAIKNIARNRIAHRIANNIIRNYPDPQFEEEGGGWKYSYHFKVIDMEGE